MSRTSMFDYPPIVSTFDDVVDLFTVNGEWCPIAWFGYGSRKVATDWANSAMRAAITTWNASDHVFDPPTALWGVACYHEPTLADNVLRAHYEDDTAADITLLVDTCKLI